MVDNVGVLMDPIIIVNTHGLHLSIHYDHHIREYFIILDTTYR